MTTLFQSLAPRPLADRLRPRSLDEVVGQDQLLSTGAPLRRMVEENRLSSIIFWGPPGTGKNFNCKIVGRKYRPAFRVNFGCFFGCFRS